MKHIWRYLQTEENKNVVVVCEHGDQAEQIIKDIVDKLKRHSITNDHRLVGYTRNTIKFGTNRVIVISHEMVELRLRGYSIDLFLEHENVYNDAYTAFNVEKIIHMREGCVVGKYIMRNDDFVSSYI